MDDLDHLLAGRDRAQDFLADGALLDPGDEILGDRQGDVSLKQGDAHLAQGLVNVLFFKSPFASELLKDGTKPLA